MNPIDYFEGLDPTPALGAERIPAEPELRQMEEELFRLGDRMTPVRLSPELRAQLGVTTLPEATALLLECAALAREMPALAAQAGDSASAWEAMIAALLAYEDARQAVVPVVQQAEACEAVLLAALSRDLDRVAAAVDALLLPGALSPAHQDVLRYRFARIDAEQEQAAASARRWRQRLGRWQARTAEQVARIERELDAAGAPVPPQD
ncbi:MAG: hypothetical protein RMK29_10455 [Myxococcales bacterium]|nr:hypothetical protein [Myxococcota bacterium]MDW8282124.1 hypothetical protein [Myxococcales bacterium]